MRLSTIGLSVTLLALMAADAQTQLPPEEFGLTAFVLTLGIPTTSTQFVGTRRFSSSVQFSTTFSRPEPDSSFTITNRWPSALMS